MSKRPKTYFPKICANRDYKNSTFFPNPLPAFSQDKAYENPLATSQQQPTFTVKFASDFVSQEEAGKLTTPRVVMEILFPDYIAGLYVAVAANFGPPLNNTGVAGRLRYGTPQNGCAAVAQNSPPSDNDIVLLDRGLCMFGEKIRHAMKASPLGVIIADNSDGTAISLMTDGLAQTPGAAVVDIPSVLVNKTTGDMLKEALRKENVEILLRAVRHGETFAEPLFASQFVTLKVNPPQNILSAMNAESFIINLDIPSTVELHQNGVTQEGLVRLIVEQLQSMNVPDLQKGGQIYFVNHPTPDTDNIIISEEFEDDDDDDDDDDEDEDEDEEDYITIDEEQESKEAYDEITNVKNQEQNVKTPP